MFQRQLFCLLVTILSLPVLAQSAPKASYRASLNHELIITTAKDEQVIAHVFSTQETGAEYSALAEFNHQAALFYSSKMDELYFTLSQTNPELIDCVYVSLRTQINVPVRKFRCGLNEKISPSLFEQHRDDFANTLPAQANDLNIAAQVNSTGKVIIPISQAEHFEVQAVYTTQNLENGEPDMFIVQDGVSTKINANGFYVEYKGKDAKLNANRLFKVVSNESTTLAPFTE